jgi:hypothetical protein
MGRSQIVRVGSLVPLDSSLEWEAEIYWYYIMVALTKLNGAPDLPNDLTPTTWDRSLRRFLCRDSGHGVVVTSDHDGMLLLQRRLDEVLKGCPLVKHVLILQLNKVSFTQVGSGRGE